MRFHAHLKRWHLADLYLVLAGLVTWDFLYTFLELSGNAAVETNPVGAFFVSVFGPQFFVFGLPVAWAFLYGVIDLGGWFVHYTRKGRQLNGKNDTAFVMILLVAPNVLEQMTTLLAGRRLVPDWDFRYSLVSGLVLVTIYAAITEWELWQNAKDLELKHKKLKRAKRKKKRKR